MDGSNILSGGKEQLNEMKECLLELYEHQSNNDSFLLEEERLENRIADLEQAMKEEIQKTTKKRRQEIEDTFEEQEDKLQTRIKRIKEKRERSKNAKVSQRIETETASLRTENTQWRLEAKIQFRQKHIPGFCNTKLYYALYSPSCFTDFILILLTLMVTLLLIPCGIYFLILQQDSTMYLILTYIFTVILFGGLYLLIGNRTKGRSGEEIHKVKGIRKQIRINKKKIALIRKNIRRDRDESIYGLQNFDDDLAKLEQEQSEVVTQKKAALAAFDNSTYQIIASEIEANYKEKLSAQRAEYDKVRASSMKAEETMKALSIKIASEYEPFLGKEYMSIKRVDTLISILEAGNATNISEAIAFYKLSQEKDENTAV